MLIVVTRLGLRSWLRFPAFVRSTRAVNAQMESSQGLLDSGFHFEFPHHFWTMTAWKDEASMRLFRNSGAHLEAMRLIGKLAKNASTLTFTSGEMPVWKDVKCRVRSSPETRHFTYESVSS